MRRITTWRQYALIVGCLLALTGCAAPERTSSSGAACNGYPTPDVTVEFETAKPIENRELDIAQLSNKQTLGKSALASQGYKETLGITDASLDGDLDGDVHAVPTGSDWCAYLQHVRVTVHWKTTVYMAKELIPGSCPYRAVRDHEQKHIDLDSSMRSQLQASIELAVKQATGTTQRHSDGHEAISDLNSLTQTAAQKAVDDFAAQRDERQSTIDTPAEYDRVVAVCGRDAFPAMPGEQKTGI